jgi:hypothetical protein
LLVVFVSHLARPVASEAGPIAEKLGLTEYEIRLALSAPAPAILLLTTDRERAEQAAGVLRSRGHGAHVFDDASFVPSEEMTRLDDFRLDADGVRRAFDGALLPYGDVFAILTAMHATSGVRVRAGVPMLTIKNGSPRMESRDIENRVYEREPVAYFFRRSGERPWILRERHANYGGLGAERQPIAHGNFLRLIARIQGSCPSAMVDDRLIRRRVAERFTVDSKLRSSSEGMDLLAHLLAMAIASQGGSPYR